MVTMPIVQNGLPGAFRHRGCQVPGAGGMVSLARAVSIHRAIVDAAPGCAIMLRGANHSAEPPRRCVKGYLFKDAKANISLKSRPDCFLPMERHCAGNMAGNWSGRRINMQLKGWAATDEG